MENLSLKYRPQSLEQVIGQKQTLWGLETYIVNSDQPQSILLSGPRGIGKTSTARIIAKMLNCGNPPCLDCPICEDVTNNNFTDLVELDAATNRGIDTIRTIIERAYYAPVNKFKIFVLDEAHMLTREASNALLKILEEPPNNVLFILATTEEHRLLPTIKSRLKTYRFNLVPQSTIENHIQILAEAEELKISTEIIEFIAAEGKGSVRDAVRTLDDVRELGEDVTLEMVQDRVGLASQTQVVAFLDTLFYNDLSKAFLIIGEVQQSKEIDLFYEQILDALQQVLYQIVGLDSQPEYAKYIPYATNQTMTLIFDKLTYWYSRFGRMTRVGLELAMTEICQKQPDMLVEKVFENADKVVSDLIQKAAQSDAQGIDRLMLETEVKDAQPKRKVQF